MGAGQGVSLARPDIIESWLPEVIELMARKGIELEMAVAELNIPVSTPELTNIKRRKSFDRLLWTARHKYFNELATDPSFKKDTVIGRMLNLAQKLEQDGQYDKAAEALFKAAKAAGFVGPEQTVSIFGELSQADIDALKTTVREKPLSVN